MLEMGICADRIPCVYRPTCIFQCRDSSLNDMHRSLVNYMLENEM